MRSNDDPLRLRDEAVTLRSAGLRHNPKTVRKNVSDDYHGCLCVRVRKCAELYQKIEGWASAVMRGAEVTWPGQAPNLISQQISSRGRIRTFVEGTKNPCPARLDDPGPFGS